MPPLVETKRQQQHSTWIEIHRDRLISNLRTMKDAVRPFAGVLAVIKANAYGHGLIETARTLEGSADFFGVSSIREALSLKENQIPTPVLLFGRLLEKEMPAALVDGIVLSVSDFDEAAVISRLSTSLNRKTPVHLKIDTGMGRLGMPLPGALEKIEKIARLPGILLDGIYTHFPTAEKNDGFTENQISEFTFLLVALEKKGLTFRWRHAANSAASLKLRTPVLNLARTGLMLYGIYPDPSLKSIAQVSNVLTLKSRIIFSKELKTGETAGYGRDFVAEEAVTIGILPIGYSHGYPYRLSGRGSVLHQGKRYPIAGRISMDYVTVNFGQTVPRPGDEVTLIGEDQSESIKAEDLAMLSGTIPYEIVTSLDSGIPRLFL